MSINIESIEQYDQILKNNQYVIVDYFANWCFSCTKLSPRIEEIAVEYPHIKVLTVDYDLLDEIIDREQIDKLPTLKTFHNGELVQTTVGNSIFTQLEEIPQLWKKPTESISSQSHKPTESISSQSPESISTESISSQSPESISTESISSQSPQSNIQKSPTPAKNIQLPAFLHPADAAAGMSNVPIGSSRFPHLKPTPPELIQFQSSLASFSVVLFTHASQLTSPATNSSSYGTRINIVDQTVNDLKLLIDASKTPLMFKHIIISDADENSRILAEEYGATQQSQLPIIKLIYKTVCYATFTKGDTFEVEKTLLDFVQL